MLPVGGRNSRPKTGELFVRGMYGIELLAASSVLLAVHTKENLMEIFPGFFVSELSRPDERNTMAYLDASPMISALRTDPEVFELRNGYLHHIPSRHRFHFDPACGAKVHAECACSSLEIAQHQQPALLEAFHEWRANYWAPIEINQEFAEHFHARSWLRQRLIKMASWLLRALAADYRHVCVAKARLVPSE